MKRFRTVLHATDFSDQCRPAFEIARALARDYGAKLEIVHALPLSHGSLHFLQQVKNGCKTLWENGLRRTAGTGPTYITFFDFQMYCNGSGLLASRATRILGFPLVPTFLAVCSLAVPASSASKTVALSL